MNDNKFVAKSKRILNDEHKLPSVHSAGHCAPFTVSSDINIDNLVSNLSTALKKPAPKTWLGRWFQTRRIELDQQRIDSLCSYAETIQKANIKVTQTQVELQFAPAILRLLMQGNLLKAQQDIQLQVREHYDRIQEVNDRAESRKLQLDKLNAEIDELRAKIDGIYANNAIDMILAEKIRTTEMTGADLAKVISSLRGKNDISDEFITLIQKLRIAQTELDRTNILYNKG